MPGFQPCQSSGKDIHLHEGEVGIDVRLVRRLVAVQFPRLAGLPVKAVRSTGTVNAIYRLGDDLCARLPRLQRYTGDLVDEIGRASCRESVDLGGRRIIKKKKKKK